MSTDKETKKFYVMSRDKLTHEVFALQAINKFRSKEEVIKAIESTNLLSPNNREWVFVDNLLVAQVMDFALQHLKGLQT